MKILVTSKRVSLKQFAKINGVEYNTLWCRIKSGLSCMEAITITETQLRSMRMTKHGLRKSPTYNSWSSMHQRCKKDNDYVSKGIFVCDRWKSFPDFYSDMGDRPEGKTLDRINSLGNYDPDNCRWADVKTQMQNQTSNVNLTLNGKTQCRSEWDRELGLAIGTVYQRLKYGFTLEQALTFKKGQKRA